MKVLIIITVIVFIAFLIFMGRRENYNVNDIQLTGGWNISGSDSTLLSFANSAADKKVNFNNSVNVNGGITAGTGKLDTLNVGTINAGEINLGNWKISADSDKSLVFTDTANPNFLFKLNTGDYPSLQVVDKSDKVTGLLQFNLNNYEGDTSGLYFGLVAENGTKYSCGGLSNCR